MICTQDSRQGNPKNMTKRTFASLTKSKAVTAILLTLVASLSFLIACRANATEYGLRLVVRFGPGPPEVLSSQKTEPFARGEIPFTLGHVEELGELSGEEKSLPNGRYSIISLIEPKEIGSSTPPALYSLNYVFPSVQVAFADGPGTRDDCQGLPCGPFIPATDVRRITLNVPEDARVLTIAKRYATQEKLLSEAVSYWLEAPEPLNPSVGGGWHFNQFRIRKLSSAFEIDANDIGLLPGEPLISDELEEALDEMEKTASYEILHEPTSDDPSAAFNLVIIGDGFDETQVDQDLLLGRAEEFTNQLLGVDGHNGIEPFSSSAVKPFVRIVLGQLRSKSHGIPNCSGRLAEGSLFGFTLDTNYKCAAEKVEYIDLAAERVLKAAGLVKQQDDIVFVILNCPELGGRGYPERRLCFAGTEDDANSFVDLAAHECAHAIAPLGEENNRCVPFRNLCFEFANVALSSDVGKSTHWWKIANLTSTTTSSTTVSACSSSSSYTASGGPPGYYSPAQYTTDDSRQTCVSNYNSLGKCSFFRLQATCRMRKSRKDDSFCPVCSKCLKDIVRERAGQPVSNTPATDCRSHWKRYDECDSDIQALLPNNWECPHLEDLTFRNCP